MKKIIYSIGLAAFSLLFIQCSSDKTGSAEFTGTPISVTTNKTTQNKDGSKAVASGKLVAKNSVNVSTRMMGYISSIPVEVGQKVSAGQTLININAADIQAKDGQVQAQIAQAEANFQNAQKDFERFQNLFNSGSASQKELDDMTTRFQMAQAGLDAAHQMRSEVSAHRQYTSINAPFSGVVTAKHAEVGNMANPGMPLLTVESTKDLQAQVMVSEKYITQIKPGSTVKVILTSTGKELNGTVAEISQSATYTGGQYIVKVNIPNDEAFLPGMFVRTYFPVENTNTGIETSVLIPQSALVRNGQLQGVYVISAQNTAVLRWLKVGKKFGDQIEVLSGLGPDDTYIVSANGKLFNGAKVNVN